MPKIDVRDTNLYYEMAGDGEVSLLFIHGMCGGASDWEDQMNRLSPQFTCVAYDRRGHSRSDPGIEDQSVRTHASDVAALIDVLGLDQPVIVGESDGGAIAVELMRNNPELARGAVLSEPALLSLNPEGEQELREELGPRIEEAAASDGARAAVDAFFAAVCPSFWSQIDEAEKDRFRDNAPMLFAALEREDAEITATDLASIDTPALVVTGATSHPVLRSVTRTLAEHLPNVRSVEFEECGHVTFAEQPLAFAQAVTAFANALTGPGREFE